MRLPGATHLAVLGRAPAAVMLAAVETLMKRLKLAMNVEKTRCCRVPEESMTFLGYRIGCSRVLIHQVGHFRRGRASHDSPLSWLISVWQYCLWKWDCCDSLSANFRSSLISCR